FDVCREIKADDATKNIPVILLTALDSNEERRRGMAAGALHYLTKPFSPIDLINVLRGLIGDPPAVQTLGQYLIDEGVISHQQLAEALEMQRTLELRSEEHTSELQSRGHLVCRLLLEKKKKKTKD